ncbi:DUF86 domain-containing protein [Parasediminibacterium sp. JCM 36343]|uniref:HepT-like ribonuclease domain-containing protein n=1 Tax=Parasediminibacterium sp. JCM 36343 TaxID=3374279 RepID=UPI00397A7D1E
MRNKLGDKIRLQHMLDAIEEIEKYLINVDFAIFIENSMMRFACIKQMEIIGEASNHILAQKNLHKGGFYKKSNINYFFLSSFAAAASSCFN